MRIRRRLRNGTRPSGQNTKVDLIEDDGVRLQFKTGHPLAGRSGLSLSMYTRCGRRVGETPGPYAYDDFDVLVVCGSMLKNTSTWRIPSR